MDPYRKHCAKVKNSRHYYYRRRRRCQHVPNEERELPGVRRANDGPANKHMADKAPPALSKGGPAALPVSVQPTNMWVEPSWRLMADPFLSNIPTKIYRSNGVVPGISRQDPLYQDVIVKDRRRVAQSENKAETWQPMVLPLPAFAFNMSRGRPKVEVTFTDLHETIDKQFLTDLVKPCGKIELLQIFYHPVTKKHLGLAKIIFVEATAANICVKNLNDMCVRGKIINVFLDPFAKHCLMLYEQLIEYKPDPPLQLQIVDKSCPPKLNDYTNPISEDTSTAATIECNNMTDTNAGYNNTTVSNSFNSNPLSEESMCINSSTSLINVPAPAPPGLDFKTLRVDLFTKIKMIHSSPNVDSAFVSILNNGYNDLINTINDNINLTFSNPVNSSTSLIAVPAPATTELDFETPLRVDLDTGIDMLINIPSEDSAFVSTVNNDCADVPNTINDDFNLTLSSPLKSSTPSIAVPAPAITELDFETPLRVDLDTGIDMLLNIPSEDSAFVSTVNNDCADVPNTINDDFNLTLSSPLKSSTSIIAVPTPAITELDFETPLRVDLDTGIDMLLNIPCVDSAFVSTVNNDCANVPNTINDDFNLTFSLPSDSYGNLINSDILGCEKELPPLSNPPSPFLSKEVYLKCYETESSLNSKIQSITSNTLNLHSELSAISDDENSTKENSTVQVTETNQNYFNDYNYPPPFNIHCGYQYLSDPSNYVYDPQLPRPNVNDKELPCNEHEDKNEKGSFLKYKRDGAVKRKIDYENVENPVYSPPPLPDWEADSDTTDILDIVLKNQTVGNTSNIEDKDQLIIPSDQLQTKHFGKQDINGRTGFLFELLTEEISNQLSPEIDMVEWKVHESGCARTEGFYKMDPGQKTKYKYQRVKQLNTQSNRINEAKKAKKTKEKMLAITREACNNINQFQLLSTTIEPASYSDSLKYQILMICNKPLKVGKSPIHNMGLFAMEPIAADEMVIENVGENIRLSVGNVQKRKDEVDLNSVIDSTNCGNLARFINHSCDPNCFSKIIQIEGENKIIIYSKQQICVNEEITIDYECPLEEEKVPCLCRAHCCRGTIN